MCDSNTATTSYYKASKNHERNIALNQKLQLTQDHFWHFLHPFEISNGKSGAESASSLTTPHPPHLSQSGYVKSTISRPGVVENSTMPNIFTDKNWYRVSFLKYQLQKWLR